GLGYLYWKSHQYDEAASEFHRQLTIDPHHAQALAYLGDIEMKRSNLVDAVSLLREAVSTQNNVRLAYVDLGAILMERKQYSEAITMLQRAVKLDGSLPDAHYRLARVYQAMGKAAEAQKEFARVRELHRKADESLASKIPEAPPPLHP
ncbi:MAG: tetratricopeptide repeat protein, partial [Candidatus Sulfotelmatobacter sp.]